MATANHRRRRRHFPPTTNLTVADVLAAPAEIDPAHEVTVRTIGPALVFVLEKDAPPRMEMLAATHGEALAVQEFVRSDPVAAEFVSIYFGERAAGDFIREDAHAARLENALALRPS